MDTKSKPVYRLENSQGQGPYTGEQKKCEFLKDHLEPPVLFQAMGYPLPVFELLAKLGFVFGWRTRESYRAFFQPQGQAAARKLGYTCQIYKPEYALWLPDNQVMFLKPMQARVMEDHPVVGVVSFGVMLKALSQKPDSKNDGVIPLSSEQVRNLIASQSKKEGVP